MAGRRWPAEETTATGQGPLGWDHNQYRTWTSVQHHTARCGLALLQTNALRTRLDKISASSSKTEYSKTTHRDSDALSVEKIPTRSSPCPQPIPDRSPHAHDDPMIPLDDSMIPIRPGPAMPPTDWLYPSDPARDTASGRDRERGTLDNPDGISSALVTMAKTPPRNSPMAPLAIQTHHPDHADLTTINRKKVTQRNHTRSEPKFAHSNQTKTYGEIGTVVRMEDLRLPRHRRQTRTVIISQFYRW